MQPHRPIDGARLARPARVSTALVRCSFCCWRCWCCWCWRRWDAAVFMMRSLAAFFVAQCTCAPRPRHIDACPKRKASSRQRDGILLEQEGAACLPACQLASQPASLVQLLSASQRLGYDRCWFVLPLVAKTTRVQGPPCSSAVSTAVPGIPLDCPASLTVTHHE